MDRIKKTFLWAALFLTVGAPLVRADGLIVLHPPRQGVTPIPLSVKYHHVDTTISDRFATTTVDQVFVNPNNMRLEGTYIFPLPEKAAISKMSMWIDGQEVEGEILPRDEAVKIYTDIVRRMKDPAILEYMGTRLFRMRIFPIEPRGEKQVKISYSETVPTDSGLSIYRYPLSTEKFSSRPLDEVVISVRLQSKRPLKTVFSPSHEVDVVRKDDHAAIVGYEKRNVTPNKDFILYYSLSDGEFGASLASFRRKGEDGYFSMFVTPKQASISTEVVEKDVVFVIDTSGSMKEPDCKPWKIDQAKEALRFCVKSLNPGDRFNIVSYATAARKFRQTLQPAGSEIVEEALEFIGAMKAGGGTNIQAALEEALGLQDRDDAQPRPFMVVFLTDGLPTVGEIQRAEDLTALAKRLAGPSTRLFAFGVGYDVNTRLLDKLALDNRGERLYVAPEENIEVRVSAFYEKIASPVLSDVKIAIDGIETYDLFPSRLPDLFRGSQLVIHGRYKGAGSKAVRLGGMVNKVAKEFVYECSFAEVSKEHAAIPRLWATTKIGYLLDQLRLKGINVAAGQKPTGPDKEVVDEIVALATEFGIVTPYTALLVMEDETLARAPMRRWSDRGRDLPEAEEALAEAPMGFGRATGKGAVDASKELKRLRAGVAREEADSEFGQALNVAQTVRRIGDKTFFLVDGVWYDSVYREGTAATRIVFLSEEYFDLVTKHPEIARYLSAGARTVLCLGGTCYEIVSRS